ncbi:hypothetical protein [Solimonas sp. SE-A11]|uniref:hypothetical protein n=1 Tax=Solimonas sp. SE-A11 TaxID=3054954 RepID=UPI00259CB030|nr:hypothetical protein [Solimonas sp. SE-A11]MDM4769184.1 hypothetical protein [Solimonas sp. SE-A11]
MAGAREGLGFSYGEREEFQRSFERAAARLPGMFRSFWHRWEETSGIPPEFIVHAEDGTQVLRVTRLNSGGYRAAGVTGQGSVIYAVAARSITDAFKAAGLL